jgi:hypothetical protein
MPTELEEIVLNLSLAVDDGEITQEKAVELLNDFQDHEYEAMQAVERIVNSLFFPRKFINYFEYIASPEWKRKSETAKRDAGYRCQVCNRSQNEVQLDAHHRTYERLGHERPEDITVLCHECHGIYERQK